MDARKTPLAELRPERICLIKPSALGDVVQTLPLLAGLRARWPQAKITWVLHRGLVPLLEGQPGLDGIVPFDRQQLADRPWASVPALWRELRAGRFDLAIDVQGLLRSGAVTWATGAARRVGFANAREGASLAYTDLVAVPDVDLPAVERYWLLAAALGCEGAPRVTAPSIPDSDRRAVVDLLHGLPRPWLAIHPGARWETKRWPPASFSQVADRAVREFGASIVLLGGPEETLLTAAVRQHLKTRHVVDLAGRTTLKQLAAACDLADMLLSNDSGPMHLAAACSTPVLGVFTCTSPRRAGPFGAGHRIAATGVACAASYVRTCPTMHCMAELVPERVWPLVRAALSDWVAHPSRQAS
ncbi:MAG: glycosyltransferase family 9 protein [Pirellulales bacterium]|nr:glycosyltransferase family 9 protein [Pirellulales bacterium]